jgi:glycerol-3-phosphate dehydrogenase
MSMRVAVVGAGSWGTTVAHLARNPIVCKLAEANGVYTPIADQMRACVEERCTALEAYAGLVNTPAAREIDPH